ncbi:MAG: helix-turn-helix domain-containing protein [Solirubrobacteraceae bacterium]
MSVQGPRRDEETSALYVRLPRPEAEKLDRIAFEHRRPKREIIRALVADHLPDDGRLVVSPLSPDVVVGRADFAPAQASDVLTPAQAAELLQAGEAAVIALAESGELPGRQVGGEWRFLRGAVLAWLGGGA